jgi:hypothetical protein
MTNTCNSTTSTKCQLAKICNGYTLFYHYHQLKVWVTNVLDNIGKYLSVLSKDNTDDIALELCVYACFEYTCCLLGKEFYLYAKYPKGWGFIFHQ